MNTTAPARGRLPGALKLTNIRPGQEDFPMWLVPTTERRILFGR